MCVVTRYQVTVKVTKTRLTHTHTVYVPEWLLLVMEITQ